MAAQKTFSLRFRFMISGLRFVRKPCKYGTPPEDKATFSFSSTSNVAGNYLVILEAKRATQVLFLFLR